MSNNAASNSFEAALSQLVKINIIHKHQYDLIIDTLSHGEPEISEISARFTGTADIGFLEELQAYLTKHSDSCHYDLERLFDNCVSEEKKKTVNSITHEIFEKKPHPQSELLGDILISVYGPTK